MYYVCIQQWHRAQNTANTYYVCIQPWHRAQNTANVDNYL